MKPAPIRTILTIIIFSISYNSSAQPPQGEDLEQLYGGKDVVSIATGTKQPIARAPSVASVITYDQMKAMGATNLSQVLETVPGLHVSPSSYGFSPIYSIRGIYTNFNPQVLMLMNGVPMNQVYLGNRGYRSTLPIENISRVEVIRGPGSAVYGADAFAGVINVITKDANEIDGTHMGVRAGSFDSQRTWLLHGGTWAGTKVAFSLEWTHSDGDNGRIIQADGQTAFDKALGTHASLAPGPANTRQKRLDLHLDLSRGNLRFHIWNWRQYNLGEGPGLALALDPTGGVDTDNYLTYVTYKATPSHDLDLRARISYMYIDFRSFQHLYPPGTVLPIGSDGNVNPVNPKGIVSFPDGLIGNPDGVEHHARFDFFSVYRKFTRHRLRFGAGVAYADLRPRETKNFGPGVIDGSEQVVNGSLTNVTNTPYIYIKKKDRVDDYASVQDEWDFARDWSLTAGVRYDHYTNFGDTINPRAALVWQTRYDLTTKFLYGRAFRAPSFSELYTINNPIHLGNPNLRPEKTNTYEIAFNYNPTFNVHGTLNLFHYDINDLILSVPDNTGATFIFQNAGAQTGNGGELEIDWNILKNLKLTGNFAFQKSINKNTHSDAANAPGHQLYARLNWQFRPQWSLVPQVNWVMDRKRAAGDPRPPLKDYAIVNVALRRTQIADHWELAMIVDNLFDSNAVEPSPYSQPAPAIPYDFPMPGRSIYGEVRFHF